MPRYRHIQSVVPPGEYDVIVKGGTLKQSTTGNEMMVLRVATGLSGRWFREHLVFADNSYWRIAQFLTAMGKQLTADEDVDPGDYVNCTARAVVGVHDYKGKPQNFIQKWLPPKSEPANDNPPSEESK